MLEIKVSIAFQYSAWISKDFFLSLQQSPYTWTYIKHIIFCILHMAAWSWLPCIFQKWVGYNLVCVKGVFLQILCLCSCLVWHAIKIKYTANEVLCLLERSSLRPTSSWANFALPCLHVWNNAWLLSISDKCK